MKPFDTAANCAARPGGLIAALTIRIAREAGDYEERG